MTNTLRNNASIFLKALTIYHFSLAMIAFQQYLHSGDAESLHTFYQIITNIKLCITSLEEKYNNHESITTTTNYKINKVPVSVTVRLSFST